MWRRCSACVHAFGVLCVALTLLCLCLCLAFCDVVRSCAVGCMRRERNVLSAGRWSVAVGPVWHAWCHCILCCVLVCGCYVHWQSVLGTRRGLLPMARGMRLMLMLSLSTAALYCKGTPLLRSVVIDLNNAGCRKKGLALSAWACVRCGSTRRPSNSQWLPDACRSRKASSASSRATPPEP